ncbi:MAG: hypothetical protein AB1716_21590 [Planctomycetota bacterium]
MIETIVATPYADEAELRSRLSELGYNAAEMEVVRLNVGTLGVVCRDPNRDRWADDLARAIGGHRVDGPPGGLFWFRQ